MSTSRLSEETEFGGITVIRRRFILNNLGTRPMTIVAGQFRHDRSCGRASSKIKPDQAGTNSRSA